MKKHINKINENDFIDNLLGGKIHTRIISIIFFTFLMLQSANQLILNQIDAVDIFLFVYLVSGGAYALFRIIYTLVQKA